MIRWPLKWKQSGNLTGEVNRLLQSTKTTAGYARIGKQAMRKTAQVTPTASTHRAYAPLEQSQLKDDAERLFEKYLETFAAAPEADFLLKRYFFDIYFEKEYLQDNVFLIPRYNFLWFFTYYRKQHEERTIALKKRATSKAETEVEKLTMQFRTYYKVDEGPVDIIYTRFFEDGQGETYTLKNTLGAVALAEKLLLDFREDTVTAHR